MWKRRGEPRTQDEPFSEGSLVIFQLLLPVPHVDNYAASDLLCVRQKLVESDDRNGDRMRSAKGRVAGGAAVSDFVEPFDQVTRVLKFNLE